MKKATMSRKVRGKRMYKRERRGKRRRWGGGQPKEKQVREKGKMDENNRGEERGGRIEVERREIREETVEGEKKGGKIEGERKGTGERERGEVGGR